MIETPSQDELKALDSEPLYKQLEKYIRSAIVSGEVKPGDKIETEEELSERFGVSRITVRNAISILVEDGYLIKKQGKGTFVCQPKMERNIVNFSNFSLICEINGVRAGSKLISTEMIKPTPFDIRDLNIPEKSRVVFMKRVRFAGNEAVMIEKNYFPESYSFLLKEKINNHSLYKILKEKYNIIPTSSVKTLELSVASREDAMLLNIPYGSPLFDIKGIVYDQNEKPIHRSEQLIIGDRFKFFF